MEISDIICNIKKYAYDFKVPIIQDGGLSFLIDFIKENNIKNILEIGSAIGYSSIKMALIDDDITVTTIERDKERYTLAKENIKNCNLENRINLIFGDALEIDVDGKYDLIFIDAAKAQNKKFFLKYSPYLNNRGFIIVDNLKFHGFVENPSLTNNRNTKQLVRKIKDFITWLKENEEYDTTILDIGDGLAVSKRK